MSDSVFYTDGELSCALAVIREQAAEIERLRAALLRIETESVIDASLEGLDDHVISLRAHSTQSTGENMSDIVERLRARHSDTWPVQVGLDDYYNPDGPEAADEIVRLREALRDILGRVDHETAYIDALYAVSNIARKALEGKDE